jgi:hypothetical protein
MFCAQPTACLSRLYTCVPSTLNVQVLVWVEANTTAVAALEILATSAFAMRSIHSGAMEVVLAVVLAIVKDGHCTDDAFRCAVPLVRTLKTRGWFTCYGAQLFAFD